MVSFLRDLENCDADFIRRLSLQANREAWVLTIYTGKPEIPVGKSNGSRHSVWEASENMGCNMR